MTTDVREHGADRRRSNRKVRRLAHRVLGRISPYDFDKLPQPRERHPEPRRDT